MSDQDLRRQAREIREALERFDRDQLVEILTHVFKQYVIEGTLPVEMAAPGAATDELQGLSFAQLIERLQLRLDLPELQLFEVQSGRVSVKTEGRQIPLEAPRPETPGRLAQVQVSLRPQPAAPPPAAPAAAAAPAQPAAPPAAPGVIAVGPVGRAAPAPAQVPAAPAAPRPGAAAAQAKPAAAPAAKEERGADDAARFNLLEID